MSAVTNFTVNIKLKLGRKSNIKTLFHDEWRYFTIPSKVHKEWENDEGVGRYAFSIDPQLLEKYKNNADIYCILKSIEEECQDSYMEISQNIGTLYTDNAQIRSAHYRCRVSLLLLRKLKLLFISSYVYNSAGKNFQTTLLNLWNWSSILNGKKLY